MAVRQRETVEKPAKPQAASPLEKKQPVNLVRLVVCVLGIYVSFLSWAVLQERISTTPYGADQRVFRASNAISIVQSFFAFLAGVVFVKTTKAGQAVLPSNGGLIKAYALIALCHTLSGPFSYASLKYVDYVTMLLAKSCKLLPVMFVHLTLYRTKFPAYKYVVVLLVTAGVFLFSFYGQSQPAKGGSTDNQGLGLALLGCGLFLDGLYNTTQDQIFKKYGPTGEVSGPHMMVVMNLLTSLFSTVALVVSGQAREVAWFASRHPIVFRDIALFAACGALGQIFIFLTLESFGSLVLVTTTVTRKMISMLLSVVLFNHKLQGMQWLGVLLVFGGVAGEALYKFVK